MTDESRRVPIKVKVVDKRKTHTEPGSETDTSSEAPSAPLRETVFNPPLRKEASSSDELDSRSADAGFGFGEPTAPLNPESVSDEESASPSASTEEGEEEKNRDYLQDLLRVQAEFDNFRKRSFRERQQAEGRGKRGLISHLLPVLDNFELAIAHGEGGDGVELVFKELKSSLEREGLAEILAEGRPFDPQVHEAVESREDPDVSEPFVIQVYRRGYMFGDEVVRPAMVVVARPADDRASDVAEGG